MRAALAANRAQLFLDLPTGPFYSFNRAGAKVSQGSIYNWWRQGMMGGAITGLRRHASGFGDVVPTSPSLRLAAPLEALFGLMLVTAAVSWVLEIYPALHRRRVLALQLSTLRKARQAAALGIDAVPIAVLTALAPSSIVEARNDFTQYGATYYFRDLEVDASLAASLEYATHLAAEATASPQPQMRLTGALLTAAVENPVEILDQEFLQRGGFAPPKSSVRMPSTIGT